MAEEEDADVWSDDGVRTHHRWRSLRVLAQDALAAWHKPSAIQDEDHITFVRGERLRFELPDITVSRIVLILALIGSVIMLESGAAQPEAGSTPWSPEDGARATLWLTICGVVASFGADHTEDQRLATIARRWSQFAAAIAAAALLLPSAVDLIRFLTRSIE